MQFLLSVNSKFFVVEPSRLIGYWREFDSNHTIGGCEFYVNPVVQHERAYVTELARLMSGLGWKLQVHAPDVRRCIDLELLKYYDSLAQITGHDVLLTVHPTSIYSDPVVDATDSGPLFSNLLTLIEANHLKLQVAAENLNNLGGKVRCKIEHLSPIITSTKGLGLCWDVGHEVSDGACTYSIAQELVANLKNVHIHDISEAGDHHPFYYGRANYQKAKQYLQENGYTGSVVLELALDYLRGEDFVAKQREYVRQCELLAFGG